MTMGFWKTVGAGVLVVIATKAIDAASDSLPAGLAWLGSAASAAWGLFVQPIATPIYIFIVGLILYLNLYTDHHYLKKRVARQTALQAAESAELAAKNTKVNEEERAVLQCLVKADSHVEHEKLRDMTQLTAVRFRHAVSTLRDRDFLQVDKNRHDEYLVWLKPKGTAYIVENNLDLPPEPPPKQVLYTKR